MRNRRGGGEGADPSLQSRANLGSVLGIRQVTESPKMWELETQVVGHSWGSQMEPEGLRPPVLWHLAACYSWSPPRALP